MTEHGYGAARDLAFFTDAGEAVARGGGEDIRTATDHRMEREGRGGEPWRLSAVVWESE